MNGLTLLHAERWWVLVLLPLLVWLLVWDRRRRARRREAYADPGVAPLVFERVPRPGILRAMALVFGTALMLFALLEPSWGRLPLPVSKRAADIVFCLDLSRSMRTKDIPGGRGKRARLDLLSILDKLGGNRVALVGFAKSARIFCPLTHDAKAFRFLLGRAEEDEVEQGPTDLGAALRASLTLLPEAEGAYQAVVLLSDGEDLVQSVDRVVPILAKRGVPLHCIGYGTVQGAPIPDPTGMDVLRDEKRKPIISHMDVETLRRLADRTGGVYLAAQDNPLPLVELWNKRILAMQTRETDKSMRTVPISRFQWFLLPGFLLLAFGLRPRGSRNGKRKGQKPHGDSLKKVAAAAFLPLVFFQGGELRRGVELLRRGDAKQALKLLEAAKNQTKQAGPALLLDHAIAAFRAGKTEEAMASAEKLVAKTKALRPERDLIVGTARLAEALQSFKKKDLKGAEEKVRRAIQALEDSVVARPTWKASRENLERSLNLLRQIEERKKQQKKNKKQDKKQDKKKKKDGKKKNDQQKDQNKKGQDKKSQDKKSQKKKKGTQKKDKKSQGQKSQNQKAKNQKAKDQKAKDQKEKEVPKAPKKEDKKNPKKGQQKSPKQKSKQKPEKKSADQKKQAQAKKKNTKKDKGEKDKGKKNQSRKPKLSKGQKGKGPNKPGQAIPMRLSPEERAQLEEKLRRLILEARKNEKPKPTRHVPGKKDW